MNSQGIADLNEMVFQLSNQRHQAITMEVQFESCLTRKESIGRHHVLFDNQNRWQTVRDLSLLQSTSLGLLMAYIKLNDDFMTGLEKIDLLRRHRVVMDWDCNNAFNSHQLNLHDRKQEFKNSRERMVTFLAETDQMLKRVSRELEVVPNRDQAQMEQVMETIARIEDLSWETDRKLQKLRTKMDHLASDVGGGKCQSVLMDRASSPINDPDQSGSKDQSELKIRMDRATSPIGRMTEEKDQSNPKRQDRASSPIGRMVDKKNQATGPEGQDRATSPIGSISEDMMLGSQKIQCQFCTDPRSPDLEILEDGDRIMRLLTGEMNQSVPRSQDQSGSKNEPDPYDVETNPDVRPTLKKDNIWNWEASNLIYGTILQNHQKQDSRENQKFEIGIEKSRVDSSDPSFHSDPLKTTAQEKPRFGRMSDLEPSNYLQRSSKNFGKMEAEIKGPDVHDRYDQSRDHHDHGSRRSDRINGVGSEKYHRHGREFYKVNTRVIRPGTRSQTLDQDLRGSGSPTTASQDKKSELTKDPIEDQAESDYMLDSITKNEDVDEKPFHNVDSNTKSEDDDEPYQKDTGCSIERIQKWYREFHYGSQSKRSQIEQEQRTYPELNDRFDQGSIRSNDRQTSGHGFRSPKSEIEQEARDMDPSYGTRQGSMRSHDHHTTPHHRFQSKKQKNLQDQAKEAADARKQNDSEWVDHTGLSRYPGQRPLRPRSFPTNGAGPSSSSRSYSRNGSDYGSHGNHHNRGHSSNNSPNFSHRHHHQQAAMDWDEYNNQGQSSSTHRRQDTVPNEDPHIQHYPEDPYADLDNWTYGRRVDGPASGPAGGSRRTRNKKRSSKFGTGPK